MRGSVRSWREREQYGYHKGGGGGGGGEGWKGERDLASWGK